MEVKEKGEGDGQGREHKKGGGKRMRVGRMEGREVEGGMGKGVEGETGKHV